MGLLRRSFSNLGVMRQLSNAIGRFDTFAQSAASNWRGKRKRALRLCRFQPFIESLDTRARIDLGRPTCCLVKLSSIGSVVALVARSPRLECVFRPVAV